MQNPCKDCEKKGCGSYHDQCEKFKEYKEFMQNRKVEKQAYLRDYLAPSTFKSRTNGMFRTHKK